MKCSGWIIVAAVLLSGGPRRAEAGTVTYAFAGTLNDTIDTGPPLPGIPFGTPFSGTLTYDFPQTGVSIGSGIKYTYDNLTVTIGPDTLTSLAGTLYVYDKGNGYVDDLLYTVPTSAVSGTLAGYVVNNLSLDLQNVSGGVFSGDALPAGGLTLADFTPGDATFVEFDYTVPGNPFGESFIRGDLTDLSAAPEPATLTLGGLGVAGLCGYAWRRRRVAVALNARPG